MLVFFLLLKFQVGQIYCVKETEGECPPGSIITTDYEILRKATYKKSNMSIYMINKGVSSLIFDTLPFTTGHVQFYGNNHSKINMFFKYEFFDINVHYLYMKDLLVNFSFFSDKLIFGTQLDIHLSNCKIINNYEEEIVINALSIEGDYESYSFAKKIIVSNCSLYGNSTNGRNIEIYPRTHSQKKFKFNAPKINISIDQKFISLQFNKNDSVTVYSSKRFNNVFNIINSNLTFSTSVEEKPLLANNFFSLHECNVTFLESSCINKQFNLGNVLLMNSSLYFASAQNFTSQFNISIFNISSIFFPKEIFIPDLKVNQVSLKQKDLTKIRTNSITIRDVVFDNIQIETDEVRFISSITVPKDINITVNKLIIMRTNSTTLANIKFGSDKIDIQYETNLIKRLNTVKFIYTKAPKELNLIINYDGNSYIRPNDVKWIEISHCYPILTFDDKLPKLTNFSFTSRSLSKIPTLKDKITALIYENSSIALKFLSQLPTDEARFCYSEDKELCNGILNLKPIIDLPINLSKVYVYIYNTFEADFAIDMTKASSPVDLFVIGQSLQVQIVNFKIGESTRQYFNSLSLDNIIANFSGVDGYDKMNIKKLIIEPTTLFTPNVIYNISFKNCDLIVCTVSSIRLFSYADSVETNFLIKLNNAQLEMYENKVEFKQNSRTLETISSKFLNSYTFQVKHDYDININVFSPFLEKENTFMNFRLEGDCKMKLTAAKYLDKQKSIIRIHGRPEHKLTLYIDEYFPIEVYNVGTIDFVTSKNTAQPHINAVSCNNYGTTVVSDANGKHPLIFSAFISGNSYLSATPEKLDIYRLNISSDSNVNISNLSVSESILVGHRSTLRIANATVDSVNITLLREFKPSNYPVIFEGDELKPKPESFNVAFYGEPKEISNLTVCVLSASKKVAETIFGIFHITPSVINIDKQQFNPSITSISSSDKYLISVNFVETHYDSQRSRVVSIILITITAIFPVVLIIGIVAYCLVVRRISRRKMDASVLIESPSD